MKPLFDSPPELSSELEWLLQNGEASRAALANVLVREYYASALRLSWAILGDLGRARQIVLQAFTTALVNQYRYRSGKNAHIWLFQFILQAARKAARLRGSSSVSEVSGGAALEPGLDVFHWPLDEADQWSLYLTGLLGWQPAEAAELIGIEVGRVKRLVDALRQGFLPPSSTSQPVRESITLEQALRDRFPQQSLTEEELVEIVAWLLHAAEQRSTRNLRLVRLWEALVTAVGISLVAGLIWWLNQSLPDGSQQSLKSAPTRRIIQVTRIVLVPITPTPESPDRVLTDYMVRPGDTPALPPPLTANSTPREIIQRLTTSQSLWSTLWVDARLNLNGPPGYIGPPDVTYEQLWVDNVGKRSIELSGKSSTQPDWVYASSGNGGTQIDRKTSQRQDFPSNQLIKSDSLRAMVFPLNSDWISSADNLVIGPVTPYIGRETLQVGVENASGFLQAQLWVDVETGVILRELHFSGDSSQIQTADFSINKIYYNDQFYDGLFNPQERLAAGFSADASGLISKLENHLVSPENSQTYQSSPPKVDPPGLNPAQAMLYFRYPENFNTKAASAEVEVFAGGRSLGTTQFGNPWTMICTRSPDGGKIAYVSQPLNPENGDATLHWFDLRNVSQNHLVSEDLVVDNFAFSYDGQKLAFFGRQVDETRGAVYIYNLQKGSLQLLLDRNSARSLAWSPDGNYLAMLSAPSMLGTQNALVVQVLNGETVARDRYNWQGQASIQPLSPSWPTFDWRYPDGTYVKFPAVMGGLQACTLPNIQGPD
jgi:DNA-directed RNA polymerase specialized sigma24 family protein/WD40 repeat protein